MSVLAVAWQYLTGRAVATDPTERMTAEWPPHPDRVFQALVAAWGEGAADPAAEAALRWLEALPPPQLVGPGHERVTNGKLSKVYVPVNDIEGSSRRSYGEKQLALLPSQRTRKERYFPSTLVGDAASALIWPDAEPGEHRAALARLCAQAVRIGHSRSLVRMWLWDDPPAPTWVPAVGAAGDCMLRCPAPGRFSGLLAAFAAQRRPDTAPWVGYTRAKPVAVPRGAFDPRMLILRRVGGDDIFLPGTLAFTEALRRSLIAQAEGSPELRTLVSGHNADGTPAQVPHAAYLPLPFVGDLHADGHLLGLAVVIPSDVGAGVEFELAGVVARWLDTGGELRAGGAGAATFAVEERPVPPKALRSATWTTPSRRWGTVTPIVLDRYPPRRHTDHDAWAAEQIALGCTRQGLPAPVEVGVLPVSRHIGAPAARAFPPLPRRVDGGGRWHVHAVLTFPVAIAGPLALGAGRYRGYGLCRPGEDR